MDKWENTRCARKVYGSHGKGREYTENKGYREMAIIISRATESCSWGLHISHISSNTSSLDALGRVEKKACTALQRRVASKFQVVTEKGELAGRSRSRSRHAPTPMHMMPPAPSTCPWVRREARSQLLLSKNMTVHQPTEHGGGGGGEAK